MARTRRELAIFLSKLKTFERPNVRLEQYSSDSNVAAQLLWNASLERNIENKTIVDLGCGTGILGIGALLLGAKHIVFVDTDANVKKLLDENLAYLDEHYEYPGTYEFVRKDVREISATTFETAALKPNDVVVVMNPPFGTKIKHADKLFLQTATKLASHIYSMHKTTTKTFLEAFAKDYKCDIVWLEDVSFPIKNTMKDHKKKVERIEVSLLHLRKH